jgi:hypothetical protein
MKATISEAMNHHHVEDLLRTAATDRLANTRRRSPRRPARKGEGTER